MTRIFESVLLMSAVGAAFTIALTLLRPITEKRFGAAWQYYMWLGVLAVMLLPISIKPPRTVTSYETAARTNIAETTKAAQTAEMDLTPVVQQIGANTDKISPIAIAENAKAAARGIPDIALELAAFIWLIGAAAVFAVKIARYFVFFKNVHRLSYPTDIDRDIHIPVRKTAALGAPLLIGLTRPTLLLPDSVVDGEIDYILKHELTHYRRRDLLYKWFAMIVSCAHWFNPFIYLAMKQIDEECEISCDAAAVRGLSELERKRYMSVILRLISYSIQGKRPLTTQMVGGKDLIIRRFAMIRNLKSKNKLMTAVSAAAAMLLCSTTVFASGMLQGAMENDYTVDVLFGKDFEKIEYANEPFVQDEAVYVPLRETLSAVGANAGGADDFIGYDNGEITAKVCFNMNKYTDIKEGFGAVEIYKMAIGKPEMTDVYHTAAKFEQDGVIHVPTKYGVTVPMANAPVMKDGVTYVPMQYIEYIIHNYDYIEYNIYDKAGNPAKNVVRMTIDEMENISKNYTYFWFGWDYFDRYIADRTYTGAAAEKYLDDVHGADDVYRNMYGNEVKEYDINDTWTLTLEKNDMNAVDINGYHNANDCSAMAVKGSISENLFGGFFDRAGCNAETKYWDWDLFIRVCD